MKYFKSLPSIVIAVIGLSLVAATAPQSAPVESIRAALSAAGSPDVKTASPAAFTKALTSVLSGVKPKDIAQYVAAAVKLRKDLAAAIVKAAFAMLQAGGTLTADLAASIVKAAVAADPSSAVTIVQAAVGQFAAGREAIVAAAISAAPDQKAAIKQAASDAAGTTSERGPRGNENANSSSASTGTQNPSNTKGDANSDEKGNRVTICHRSGNGSGKTLTLPRKAAEQHLRQHPKDSLGACP